MAGGRGDTLHPSYSIIMHLLLKQGGTEVCMMDAMYQEPGCGWR